MIFLLGASTAVQAQSLKGRVFQKDDKGNLLSLPGANVYWLNGTEGVQTDIQGRFEIKRDNQDQLLVQFIGFKVDTLEITNQKSIEVTLKRNNELNVVEIEARQAGTIISRLDPLKTEVLTETELCKAACCNLSESFETNNSVDAVSTDAVTGTKQIQMLGLSGAYTQVLRENLPQMRGLIANTGFGQVPGTWIESIQISKGVGSVVNGFEAMAGQINIEFKKPFTSEDFQLNGYVNHMGRNELNILKVFKLSPKWRTMVLAHGDYMKRDWDRNRDGFMDNPDGKQWNIENRWQYQSKKNIVGEFGIHALQDERSSGTIHGNDGEFNPHGWRYLGKTTRADAHAKLGYVFTGKPYKSFGFLGNAFYNKSDVTLGDRWYQGEQKSVYGSFIYQSRIGTDRHSFKTGLNVQHDNFEEYFTGTPFLRIETVSGGFFEYTLNQGASTLVAGVRADYNSIFGAFVTPRIHYKLMLTENTALRVSGGRGQRTANVIAENIGFLASSRQFKIIESFADQASGFNLRPEVSWNYGGSLTHSYTLMGNEGSFSADAFYTHFERQTVIDLDASPQTLNVYSLVNNSHAFSTQFDWSQELGPWFEARLSYKYTDTKTQYLTGNLRRPFVAGHRALFNFAFHSRKDKWLADATVNYVSSKRLPDSRSNPEEFRMFAISPDYTVVNLQFTRNLKNWAVYLGIENLLDIQQQVQIVSAADPHTPYFDASYVWGPNFGRVVYVGFRWKIVQEEE